MDEPAGYAACRDAALRLLNQRQRSSAELRRRLTERGNDPLAVEVVLARLTSVGLVNDAAFATAFVRDSRHLRGHGRYRIQRELLSLGVPEELAAEALEREFPRDDELALAVDLARRRAGRLADQPDDVARRRLASFLERRGLPASVVWAAVDEARPFGGRESDVG
jgi:regulatory protein